MSFLISLFISHFDGLSRNQLYVADKLSKLLLSLIGFEEGQAGSIAFYMRFGYYNSDGNIQMDE